MARKLKKSSRKAAEPTALTLEERRRGNRLFKADLSRLETIVIVLSIYGTMAAKEIGVRLGMTLLRVQEIIDSAENRVHIRARIGGGTPRILRRTLRANNYGN